MLMNHYSNPLKSKKPAPVKIVLEPEQLQEFYPGDLFVDWLATPSAYFAFEDCFMP